MRRRMWLIPLALWLWVPARSAEMRCTLVIHFTGLRNDKGKVSLALYNKKEGFPTNARKALRTASVRPTSRTAVVTLNGLPPGEYAVVAMHDENENGKLDTGLMGIPKEGWGASNNPRVLTRAPTFEEAKFRLDANRQQLTVKMRYLR